MWGPQPPSLSLRSAVQSLSLRGIGGGSPFSSPITPAIPPMQNAHPNVAGTIGTMSATTAFADSPFVASAPSTASASPSLRPPLLPPPSCPASPPARASAPVFPAAELGGGGGGGGGGSLQGHSSSSSGIDAASSAARQSHALETAPASSTFAADTATATSRTSYSTPWQPVIHPLALSRSRRLSEEGAGASAPPLWHAFQFGGTPESTPIIAEEAAAAAARVIAAGVGANRLGNADGGGGGRAAAAIKSLLLRGCHADSCRILASSSSGARCTLGGAVASPHPTDSDASGWGRDDVGGGGGGSFGGQCGLSGPLLLGVNCVVFNDAGVAVFDRARTGAGGAETVVACCMLPTTSSLEDHLRTAVDDDDLFGARVPISISEVAGAAAAVASAPSVADAYSLGPEVYRRERVATTASYEAARGAIKTLRHHLRSGPTALATSRSAAAAERAAVDSILRLPSPATAASSAVSAAATSADTFGMRAPAATASLLNPVLLSHPRDRDRRGDGDGGAGPSTSPSPVLARRLHCLSLYMRDRTLLFPPSSFPVGPPPSPSVMATMAALSGRSVPLDVLGGWGVAPPPPPAGSVMPSVLAAGGGDTSTEWYHGMSELFYQWLAAAVGEEAARQSAFERRAAPPQPSLASGNTFKLVGGGPTSGVANGTVVDAAIAAPATVSSSTLAGPITAPPNPQLLRPPHQQQRHEQLQLGGGSGGGGRVLLLPHLDQRRQEQQWQQPLAAAASPTSAGVKRSYSGEALPSFPSSSYISPGAFPKGGPTSTTTNTTAASAGASFAAESLPYSLGGDGVGGSGAVTAAAATAAVGAALVFETPAPVQRNGRVVAAGSSSSSGGDYANAAFRGGGSPQPQRSQTTRPPASAGARGMGAAPNDVQLQQQSVVGVPGGESSFNHGFASTSPLTVGKHDAISQPPRSLTVGLPPFLAAVPVDPLPRGASITYSSGAGTLLCSSSSDSRAPAVVGMGGDSSGSLNVNIGSSSPSVGGLTAPTATSNGGGDASDEDSTDLARFLLASMWQRAASAATAGRGFSTAAHPVPLPYPLAPVRPHRSSSDDDRGGGEGGGDIHGVGGMEVREDTSAAAAAVAAGAAPPALSLSLPTALAADSHVSIIDLWAATKGMVTTSTRLQRSATQAEGTPNVPTSSNTTAACPASMDVEMSAPTPPSHAPAPPSHLWLDPRALPFLLGVPSAVVTVRGVRAACITSVKPSATGAHLVLAFEPRTLNSSEAAGVGRRLMLAGGLPQPQARPQQQQQQQPQQQHPSEGEARGLPGLTFTTTAAGGGYLPDAHPLGLQQQTQQYPLAGVSAVPVASHDAATPPSPAAASPPFPLTPFAAPASAPALVVVNSSSNSSSSSGSTSGPAVGSTGRSILRVIRVETGEELLDLQAATTQVNVAVASPVPGGPLAYGTRRGQVRLLTTPHGAYAYA